MPGPRRRSPCSRPGRFDTGPFSARNIEDFVFCQLLTEAAATVGLDYWYLSVISLAERVPMGTTLRTYGGLPRATPRRVPPVLPDWSAQRPGFFGELARFYCSGVFKGFDVRGRPQERAPPQLASHELSYGAKQREYSRLWLSFLAAEEVSYERHQLAAPVSFEEEWKQRLIHELGLVLLPRSRRIRQRALRSERGGSLPKARCAPATRLPLRERRTSLAHAGRRASAPTSLRYYVLQRVSATVFDVSDPRRPRLDIGRALRREEHEQRAAAHRAGEAPFPVELEEPRDLFVLN